MLNIALLGNPNVGKTTIFNALTGSTQYVGNWPGVTIEKKEGFLKDDIKIIDLPGIYAMDAFSNEEKVAKSYLENEDVDVILDIVDASNITRNLYLTTQLMQFDKPIIILLNMMDISDAKGIKIDTEKLAEEFGVTVVPIIAKKNKGIENIEKIIRDTAMETPDYLKEWGSDIESYALIEKKLSVCTEHTKDNKKSTSDKIDSIVLHPIFAYPIFIALLILLFKFTFDWVGGPLQELCTTLIETYISAPVDNMLVNYSPWFRSLIVDGILGGIGGTLPFFPLICTLFLGISFFEDSGYMSRTAFLIDKIMRRVGLSGKAFIPMVMGMGCSSPAIMATRTLESEKDRKITALIAPLMTCGAKLPVYALFVSIFFTKYRALVTTSLYLIGIVAAITVALFLNKTKYREESEPFILELPEYKLPTLSSLIKNTWNKSKGFLIKVVTIMFAMSVVIWAFSSFNFNGYTPDINNSFLAYIGQLLAPLFYPLGFKDWRTSVALITGLGAKEVVVNTLLVLYGDLHSVLPTVFTGVTAYAFLVFTALYTPCIAALATMKKEYGTKMMFTSLFYQFGLAWFAGTVVNIVGSAFMETSSIMEIIVTAVIVAITAVILIKIFTKPLSVCSGCSSKDSRNGKSCSGCPSHGDSSKRFVITNDEIEKNKK